MERVAGEFYIPTRVADLENAEKVAGGYKVEVALDVEALGPAERLATVQQVLQELTTRNNRPALIFTQTERFDTLYSYVKVLDQPGVVSREVRALFAAETAQLLLKVVNTTRSVMAGNQEAVPDEVRRNLRSALKMYAFLLCHLMQSTIQEENDGTVPLSQPVNRRGGGRKNRKPDVADGLDIDTREQALKGLVELIDDGLIDIWRGHQVEEPLTALMLRTVLHLVGIPANVEGDERDNNPIAASLQTFLAKLTSIYTRSYLAAIQQQQAEGQEGGQLSVADPRNIIIAPLLELMMKTPAAARFCRRLIALLLRNAAAASAAAASTRSSAVTTTRDSGRSARDSTNGEAGAGASAADWVATFGDMFFEATAWTAIHDAAGDAVKNVALFVDEVAKHQVTAVSRYSHHILPLLHCESYEVRKAAMSCIAEMLMQQYGGLGTVKDINRDEAVLRDKYLEDLLVRMRDVNAFARTFCVKLWGQLIEKRGVVPRVYVMRLVQEAVSRLKDRHYLVRKASLQLLQALVRSNTFQQVLSLHQLNERLTEHTKATNAKYNAAYAAMTGEGAASPRRSRGSTGGKVKEEVVDGANPYALPLNPDGTPMRFPEALNAMREVAIAPGGAAGDETERGSTALDKQLIRIVHYEAATLFVSRLHDALEFAANMLTSKTQQDIIEAIDFIVVCAEHRIDPAHEAVRRVLIMVFMHEPLVQKAVCEAFVSIFFDSLYNPNLPLLALNVARAHSLVGAIAVASEGELSSIERILTMLKQQNHSVVNEPLLNAVWGIVDGSLDEEATAGDRRNALRLYSMLTSCMPRDVIARKESIIDVMRANPTDNTLLGYAFNALQKESLSKVFVPIDETTDVNTHPLLSLIVHHVCRPTSRLGTWIPMCDAAINALHSLHTTPVVIYAQMVSYIATSYQENKDNARLAQLFNVLGFSALKHLVSIDNYERSQLKKIDDAVQAAQRQKESAAKKGGDNVDVMHKELGLGSTDYKRYEVAEQCLQAKANMLEDKRSIWALYGSLVVATCKQGLANKSGTRRSGNAGSPQTQPEPLPPTGSEAETEAFLRSGAIVALIKMMVASKSFCTKHLSLLFTILSRREEAWVDKTNIVIGLGDLCCVHANVLLPFMKMSSNGFYSLLADPDKRVRGTAVQICTHLVLNDMLRVNENLHAIVRLAADPDPTIAHNASMFVQHLSVKLKGNIGNFIPPLVGQLSPHMNREQFQITMKVLLDKVDGDKPTESLIEKLCARFKRFSERQQTTDLSINIGFCLAELSYASERVVKKIMSENCFNQYRQWLRHEEVFQYFQSIAIKAKRGAGAERRDRATIDEWEQRLMEGHPEDSASSSSGSDESESDAGDAAPAPHESTVDDLLDPDAVAAAAATADTRTSGGSAASRKRTRGSETLVKVKKEKGAAPSSSSDDDDESSSASSDSDDADDSSSDSDAPARRKRNSGGSSKKGGAAAIKVKKEKEACSSGNKKGGSRGAPLRKMRSN